MTAPTTTAAAPTSSWARVCSTAAPPPPPRSSANSAATPAKPTSTPAARRRSSRSSGRRKVAPRAVNTGPVATRIAACDDETYCWPHVMSTNAPQTLTAPSRPSPRSTRGERGNDSRRTRIHAASTAAPISSRISTNVSGSKPSSPSFVHAYDVPRKRQRRTKRAPFATRDTLPPLVGS